ncbi:MAG: hypothetical protein U0136_07465 [Bdellovibrionota bacterium]
MSRSTFNSIFLNLVGTGIAILLSALIAGFVFALLLVGSGLYQDFVPCSPNALHCTFAYTFITTGYAALGGCIAAAILWPVLYRQKLSGRLTRLSAIESGICLCIIWYGAGFVLEVYKLISSFHPPFSFTFTAMLHGNSQSLITALVIITLFIHAGSLGLFLGKAVSGRNARMQTPIAK